MNTELIPPPPPPPPSASVSTEETQPLSLPSFLSSSSSSLKPLRERNRTNLKRRINLSRSQVLSNDFENEDNLPTTNNTNKTTTTMTTNSQTPSTPTIHTHTELYSKTTSPTTPSPIHATVTCSQVWERLASNEEHQSSPSPKAITTPTPLASSLPTHISFSYDPSDDDEGEDLPNDNQDGFQYVPLSSQSKLIQFQFLTFARQQQLDLNSDYDNNEKKDYDSDDDDDDDDEEEEDDTLIDQNMEETEEKDDVEEQENRSSKKRKRSVSTTDSLDGIPALSATTNDATASSSTSKPPRTKKPKIKDPNANFQRLNMRKKQFSHAKKHQFGKHKRNAFYRRMRNAGGK